MTWNVDPVDTIKLRWQRILSGSSCSIANSTAPPPIATVSIWKYFSEKLYFPWVWEEINIIGVLLEYYWRPSFIGDANQPSHRRPQILIGNLNSSIRESKFLIVSPRFYRRPQTSPLIIGDPKFSLETDIFS